MTLTLRLTPDLEQRLAAEARRRGVTVQECTLQLLKGSLPPESCQAELTTLLDSWIQQGDAEEQRETGELLTHALDEDRLSDRKLFPPELKGVTW